MLMTKPWLPKEEQERELKAFVVALGERRPASLRHLEFEQYSGRDRAAGF
jgi:hypothetical protein